MRLIAILMMLMMAVSVHDQLRAVFTQQGLQPRRVGQALAPGLFAGNRRVMQVDHPELIGADRHMNPAFFAINQHIKARRFQLRPTNIVVT